MRFAIRSDENPPHEYYILKSKVIVAGAHHNNNHRQPAQSAATPLTKTTHPGPSSSTTTTTTTTAPSSQANNTGTQLSSLMSGGSKLAIFFEEASHSKILHDEKLRQMKLTNVVIEHDLGEGQVIMFVRTDAHLLMDVTQSAWFKMIQRRFNLEFVQYLDILPLQAFWNAEFAWAAAKLGCKRLLPVEKRESHARVKLPQQQQQQQQQQQNTNQQSLPRPPVNPGNGDNNGTQGQPKALVGRAEAEAPGAQNAAESTPPRFVPASAQHPQRSLLAVPAQGSCAKERERGAPLRGDVLPSLGKAVSGANHGGAQPLRQTLPGLTVSKNEGMNQSTVNGIIVASLSASGAPGGPAPSTKSEAPAPSGPGRGIPAIVGSPSIRGTPPTLKRPREPLDVDFPCTVVLPSSAAPTPSYYLQQHHQDHHHHQQQQLTPARLQQAVTLAMSRRAEGEEEEEDEEEEDESAATAGGTVQYHPQTQGQTFPQNSQSSQDSIDILPVNNDFDAPHANTEMNIPHANIEMIVPQDGSEMNIPQNNIEMNIQPACIEMNIPHANNEMDFPQNNSEITNQNAVIPQQQQQQQQHDVQGNVVLPSPQLHSGWKSDISYLCNDSDDDSLFVIPPGDGSSSSSSSSENNGNGNGNGEGDPQVIRVESDDLGIFLPPFKVLIQGNLN